MKKIYCLFLILGLALVSCKDDKKPGEPIPVTFGEVTDNGGNVYKTITVGSQTWFAENYRYKFEGATSTQLVTYGEIYGDEYVNTLSGTDMSAYSQFCKNWKGQEFVLYLREKLFEAHNAGELQTTSPYDGIWTASYVDTYPIPMLLSWNMQPDIADKLLEIWNESVDHFLKIDNAYAEKFGYLYSYEGALKAIELGAPEGFRLPSDADWEKLELALGMSDRELKLEDAWRGEFLGDMLKKGTENSIGFDALYGGAAVYGLSMAYNPRYVNRDIEAYFWCSDKVAETDSITNGIVRNLSVYNNGIRKFTSRITSPAKAIQPSYSVRLVKDNK